MTASEDHHEQILRNLRGQTLRVPDLVALIYPDWPVEKHELEPQVSLDIIENFVERWYPDKRQKFVKASLTTVAGYFCTGCPLERFLTLAQLMHWFFVWDDEIDCGNLTKDEKKTQSYHNDTIIFLKSCLDSNGLECSQRRATLGHHNSDCFQEIGDALKRGQSKEALNRFAISLYQYVDAVCHAQTVRITGLPTWEEYIENRVLNIGSYPYVMAMEYAYGVVVPSWVYETEEFKVIFRETALGIVLFNDIGSLKKEIVEEQVESAIPVKMYHEGYASAEDALGEIIEEMSKSRQRFDDAEQLFLESQEYLNMDQPAQGAVKVLIQGCKNMILGNLKWTILSKRYAPDERSEGWAATFYL